MKKTVSEKQILDAFDKYKEHLYDNKKVSATKFNAMQTAIYGCKCLINDLFDSPRKQERALTK